MGESVGGERNPTSISQAATMGPFGRCSTNTALASVLPPAADNGGGVRLTGQRLLGGGAVQTQSGGWNRRSASCAHLVQKGVGGC